MRFPEPEKKHSSFVTFPDNLDWAALRGVVVGRCVCLSPKNAPWPGHDLGCGLGHDLETLSNTLFACARGGLESCADRWGGRLTHSLTDRLCSVSSAGPSGR